MDFAIILENIGIYFEGLRTTLVLVSLSLTLGLLIAIPLAVLRTSKNYLVQAPIRAYVYFFRGTPLLVQMFIVYYGFGQFEAGIQKRLLRRAGLHHDRDQRAGDDRPDAERRADASDAQLRQYAPRSRRACLDAVGGVGHALRRSCPGGRRSAPVATRQALPSEA